LQIVPYERTVDDWHRYVMWRMIRAVCS